MRHSLETDGLQTVTAINYLLFNTQLLVDYYLLRFRTTLQSPLELST